jgi:hypothetical protein
MYYQKNKYQTNGTVKLDRIFSKYTNSLAQKYHIKTFSQKINSHLKNSHSISYYQKINIKPMAQ